ncbi:MAG: LysR family transcriptional regulator [Bryobacter sp.]|nr:LysR family transcriptional regulator [Bryobacter sp.]
MQLEHLRLFRDIAQSRSVSRGATLNKISQSAASQHLQELERQFGVRLVDRTVRPIRLTHAGLAYLDFCRDVLRRKTEFDGELDELKSETGGELRVAAIYSVGLSTMGALEAKFSERFPEASLAIEHLRPERVYDAVREERAELGLVSYPAPSREIAVLPWREEKMVLVMPPGHELEGTKRISPARLDGQEFVAFDEDLPIRKNIDRYLRDNDAEVEPIMHFDNLQSIKEAVLLGRGISIVPWPVIAQDVAAGRLRAADLSPNLMRPVGVIHRKGAKLSRSAAAFLEILREEAI